MYLPCKEYEYVKFSQLEKKRLSDLLISNEYNTYT